MLSLTTAGIFRDLGLGGGGHNCRVLEIVSKGHDGSG